MFINKNKNKIKLQLFSQSGAGFTIVEAIVVIVIISTFFVIAINNFSQSKLQFSLSRVASKFGQDVSRAQNLASSAVPYKDSLGVEQDVDGYGVYIDFILSQFSGHAAAESHNSSLRGEIMRHPRNPFEERA